MGSLHSRGDDADSCEQTGLLMQVDVENVHWTPFPHVREERSVVHENRFIGDFHLEMHMTGWRGLPFLKMSPPACPRSSHSRRIERMVDGSGCSIAIQLWENTSECGLSRPNAIGRPSMEVRVCGIASCRRGLGSRQMSLSRRGRESSFEEGGAEAQALGPS